MNIKKLTPVLYVEHIEPCLAFWARLGFEKTVEVPHEDTIGFVILKKDDTDIIYQSWDSVAADIVPRRKTFYGAAEVIVREPGDNVVTFAQMLPEGV